MQILRKMNFVKGEKWKILKKKRSYYFYGEKAVGEKCTVYCNVKGME